tara:strand:+ start:116 stop:1471 length:1356 start_codon:yes stop_codon:yes gene_type:complete
MKRKLTEATIKSLNPLDKRKIYPADYPGLELWINPGGGRTWYFQYRVKGKKHPERFRVGNYPKITIREAELRAKKIDNDLFLGKDPKEKDVTENEKLNLGDGLLKFYDEEFNESSPYYSKATVKGFRAMAKVWIFRKTNDGDIVQRLTTVKDLQYIKLYKIRPKDVEDLHKAISKRAPYVANRLVQYLRMFWNTFVKTKDNPFRLEAKKLNAEKEYLDFLSPIELKRVFAVAFRKDKITGRFLMSHYNKYKLSLVACAMICIMLATGRRTISEVASLKWDNYKAGYKPSFIYQKTKTSKKNKKVQFRIGAKAVEILQTIQRDKFNNPNSKFFYDPKDIRNAYIFPSKDFGKKIGKKKKGKTPYLVDVRKTWKKLLLLGGIERDLKLYSTRHTFASNYYIKKNDVKGGADALGVTVQVFNKYSKILEDQVVEGIDSIEFEQEEQTDLIKEVK